MAHQQSTDHELNARLLRYRSKPESQDPLALAEALLSAQRYGDARGVAVSAQPDDPADARLLLLEGQAWLLEGHLDRALDKFAAAAALEPDEAAHYQWLGRALQLRGDPLRAVHALSRAMELKPESEETRQALTAAQEALAEAEARAKRSEPVQPAPELPMVDPSEVALEPQAEPTEVEAEPDLGVDAALEESSIESAEAEVELEDVEPEFVAEVELEVEPEHEPLAAAPLTESVAVEASESIDEGQLADAYEEAFHGASEQGGLSSAVEAAAEELDADPLVDAVVEPPLPEAEIVAQPRPTIDQTQSFETSSEEEAEPEGSADVDAIAAAEQPAQADNEATRDTDDEGPIAETSPGLGPMTVVEEEALWAPTSTTSAFGDIDSPQASVSAAGDLDAPTMRSSAGDLDSPVGDWFSCEEDDALLTEQSEEEVYEASAEPEGLSDLVPSVEAESVEPAARFEVTEDPFTAALHALHSAHPSLPLVFDAVQSADEPVEAAASKEDVPALVLERSPEGVFGRQADDALNLPVAWDGPVVGAFSDSNAPLTQGAELLELSEALEPEVEQSESDGGVEEAAATEAMEAAPTADAGAEEAGHADEALFDDEHGELARTFFEAAPPPAYEGDEDAVEGIEPEAEPADERPMLSLRPVEVTRKAPATKGRALPVVASIALVAACAAGGYVVTRANMEGKGADQVLAQFADRAPSDLGAYWASLQGNAEAVSARALAGLESAREGLMDTFAQTAEEAQPVAATAPSVAEADIVAAVEEAPVAETPPASEPTAVAAAPEQAEPSVEATDAKVDPAPVRAESAAPAKPSLRAEAGLARLSKGDVDGARAVLAQLPASARKEEAGLLLRAELEILEGRPQRALHTLRHLRGSEQRSTALLNTIGRALYALDEVDRAAGAFDLALEQEPSNLTAMLGRAEVHLRAERSTDAIALLERARVARNKANEAEQAQLLTLLGHAYLQREIDGDRELAYGVLRSAIALPGAPAEAYFWLGESLAGRRTPEATRAYTTYLERAPQGRYVDRARRALGPLL